MLVWRPDNVIKGVDAGIDVFSGSYPYVLTQRAEAMTFNCKADHFDSQSDDDSDEKNEACEPKRKKFKKENNSVTIKIDNPE